MARTELIRVTPGPVGRLARAWDAWRSYWSGPLTLKSPELARFFGYTPASSGVSVTEESALTNSAVWAAVALVSDEVASLPLMLYKRLDSGGKRRYENHPLYRLLHDVPNPEMSTMVWRRTMQAHVMLWGNAYAEIERDQVGRPIAVWPLTPDRVSLERERALRYRVTNVGGGAVYIAPENMVHLVGQSYDGSVGCSLAEKARESIGLGLAAEKFGATFFGNGATFGGVISYPGARPPELAEKNYREALEARHMGVERAHKLLALYNGAKYERMGIPPNDAQFLETRVFQIREIARWFKVPPHKLGDLADATFSNVEQQNIDYYTSCLRPWLTLWEQELKRKLIASSEQNLQFIEHETKGLLRADAQGRAALYTAQFGIGAITPNEVRALENMDPIPGGDQAFVQINNAFPLEMVKDYAQAQIEKLKTPTHAPVAPKQDDAEEVKALAEALEQRTQDLTTETARRAEAEGRLVGKEEQVTSLIAERDACVQTIAQKDDALRTQDEALAKAKRDGEAKASAIATEAATQRDTLEGEIATLKADQARSGADLEQARAAIAAKEQALIDLDTTKTADLARQQAEADARIGALEEARSKAAEDLIQATMAKNDTDVMLGVAEKDLAAAKRTLADTVASEAALTAKVAEMAAERDALQAKIQTADAVAVELRAQILEAEGALELAREDQLEAAKALAAAEALRAQFETARVAADDHRAKVETEAETVKRRLGVVTVAQRAILVDAIERVLTREADRARKNIGTPEKFRGWIDTFYPLHADVCRSTFRPVMVAWTAVVGGDAEDHLDRLVLDHISESTRALRIVAEEDDPDALAAALGRVLHRWDTERAQAVADRVLRERLAA